MSNSLFFVADMSWTAVLLNFLWHVKQISTILQRSDGMLQRDGVEVS